MTVKKNFSLRWLIFYSVILLFLSLGYLLFNTQQGLNIANRVTKLWLPGNLKMAELNGRLLGPIQIKNLSYHDTDIALTVSSAQFDWHWRALLHGQFSIGSLSINKLVLNVKEKGKTSHGAADKLNRNTFKIPTFFKNISINAIDIKQSFFHYGANTLSLDGSLGKQWNLQWQATIPDLNSFSPNIKGQLFLQGKINGDNLSPHFYFFFPKTNLKYLDWQLNQVQGTFFLDDVYKKTGSLELSATQLKNDTFSLTPLHIRISGGLKPFSLLGNISGFALSRKENNATVHNIHISSSQITAKLTPKALETTLVTNPTLAGQLIAHIQFPNYEYAFQINPKQTIAGNIALNLKDLSTFSTFIPGLKNCQGALNTALNLSGSLFSPHMDGTINLQNASAEIPLLGLHLKNINLVFKTQNNTLQGTGQLKSGAGNLTLESVTQLNQTKFPSVIHLKGNNLQIIDTKEYKITASPLLQIQADTGHIEAAGDIFFPQAQIAINANSFGENRLSSDVVFVNQPKKITYLPFTYNYNLKFQLGNNVLFSYKGLHTKITGNLEINQTSEHPILATGVLSLTKGEYTYYGQKLKIQTPSLLSFTNSPIDNPSVDVTASKSVWILPSINTDDNLDLEKSKLGSTSFVSSALETKKPIPATVGVRLVGYIENPEIMLYAEPSNAITSQLDMLSYLITGQPSNQLSGASLQLLLGAATSVGGEKTGFANLINKVQKTIGIDQLTIGAQPIFNPNANQLQENTSLIIGKSLSPRLKISYSLGLLDPISIIQINYLLNKNFSLQGTNSTFENGIDLIYKIETN